MFMVPLKSDESIRNVGLGGGIVTNRGTIARPFGLTLSITVCFGLSRRGEIVGLLGKKEKSRGERLFSTKKGKGFLIDKGLLWLRRETDQASLSCEYIIIIQCVRSIAFLCESV
jgi:hypothetical protein